MADIIREFNSARRRQARYIRAGRAMRIAQVCFGRYPSPVHVGGGDVRRWQDLCTLTALGHDVHVIVGDPSNDRTQELDQLASSVSVLRSGSLSTGTPKWIASRLFNPTTLALARPNLRGLRTAVQGTLRGVGPEVVWAEEAIAVLLASGGAPIVHSHLDFLYKLKSVRRRSFAGAERFRRPDALSRRKLEALELDVCRKSAHTMCASRSEAELLTQEGIPASYVPVAGPTTPMPDFSRLSAGRLFLFGNPNTAMRAARHDLKTRVWPEVERSGLAFDWHQLGKVPRQGGDPSWDWLEEHFTIHGFVDELGDLFLPGDASIMPYPFDTGGRAKFAVSAGYGVINVAYEKTFECSDEFTHGIDCLAATDPGHFVELLRELVSDEAMRLRLAQGSRLVYEERFTMDALHEDYARILSSALGQQHGSDDGGDDPANTRPHG